MTSQITRISRIAVLDDYPGCVPTLRAFDRVADRDVAVYRSPAANLEALVERLQGAQALVLIRERTAIGDEVLARLPQLRIISTAGAVPGNLDLAACGARGIAVAQSSGTGFATAELCWSLILASRRGLLEQVASLKAGHWQAPPGRQLHGQRLGLWGFGKVARQVARYAHAFGVRVEVWGRASTLERARADGLPVAASQADFLAGNDVVSLHLKLTAETRQSITADDLCRMREDALLVNTARAELLAPGALLAALGRGRPGFAAIDVFDDEPVYDPAHPLLRHPRVLATPHVGFVERDNLEAFFEGAFGDILRFEQGETGHLLNAGTFDRAGRS